MALTVEKWAHVEKGICFISPDQPSERVVWLRCINSSWNVVFTCCLVFFALCRHIVRIRINHILVSASSCILFDPLKAERKLLLACEIWFFTCIGVIFWQVSKTQSNLTSSLALPLFSTPSMNHLFIWAKKRSSLHFNVWSSLPAREACGIARVQPFMSTKTSGKSCGLASLDFVQLGPVCLNGPPYLHSVYILIFLWV